MYLLLLNEQAGVVMSHDKPGELREAAGKGGARSESCAAAFKGGDEDAQSRRRRSALFSTTARSTTFSDDGPPGEDALLLCTCSLAPCVEALKGMSGLTGLNTEAWTV